MLFSAKFKTRCFFKNGELLVIDGEIVTLLPTLTVEQEQHEERWKIFTVLTVNRDSWILFKGKKNDRHTSNMLVFFYKKKMKTYSHWGSTLWSCNLNKKINCRQKKVSVLCYSDVVYETHAWLFSECFGHVSQKLTSLQSSKVFRHMYPPILMVLEMFILIVLTS